MLAVICRLGIPIPRVHDEFAYLLGADTYSQGRLTNPTHPLWHSFETFHVLQSPSYIPKYPPGQSLALAAGQLLGHPYLGVCGLTLSAIIATCWLGQAWLPRRWWWLLCVVAALHPAVQIVWGHSYFGGSLAWIGACILIGSLLRALRRLEYAHTPVSAIGAGILAISRPFEGAVLTSIAALIWLWKWKINGRWTNRCFVQKALLPALPVIVLVGGLLLYNNWRVTGRCTQLPYQRYESIYGLTPIFVWQDPPDAVRDYRHKVMRQLYQSDLELYLQRHSGLLATFSTKVNSLYLLVNSYSGGWHLMLIPAAWLLHRRPNAKGLALMLFGGLTAAVATPWTMIHYAAPAGPLVLLVIVATVGRLAERVSRALCNPWASRLIVLACLTIWIVNSLQFLECESVLDYRSWSKHRLRIARQLQQKPGDDLVIVRYGSDHNPHAEWVYNDADIDRAGVVWAREGQPTDLQRLIDYFANRQIWLVEADAPWPSLIKVGG
jgi:hypothetical protein